MITQEILDYLDSNKRVSAVAVFKSYEEASREKKEVQSYLEKLGYVFNETDCIYTLRFRKHNKSSVIKFITRETYSKYYNGLKINLFVGKENCSDFMIKILSNNVYEILGD